MANKAGKKVVKKAAAKQNKKAATNRTASRKVAAKPAKAASKVKKAAPAKAPAKKVAKAAKKAPAQAALPETLNLLAGKKVLVTGAAGFVGFHVAKRLMSMGVAVVGYDNINDYYEQSLKHARLDELRAMPNAKKLFEFHHADLTDRAALEKLFKKYGFEVVVHLAAQAGVRYSIQNPDSYIQSNLIGFHNILECSRHFQVKHLLYASSSSVYGGNTKTPFEERDNVDHPVSLYAATKKSNELTAHSYSHLYKIPCSGLRFFTVYGPYGRPDMATAIFSKAMLNNDPINLFNNGDMVRDFTYIDDIVESIVRLMPRPPVVDADADRSDPATSAIAPFRVYNIGGGEPVKLLSFVNTLEKALGVKAKKVMKPMQPGDVYVTSADASRLEAVTGYKPNTSIEKGLTSYAAWYRAYYKK